MAERTGERGTVSERSGTSSVDVHDGSEATAPFAYVPDAVDGHPTAAGFLLGALRRRRLGRSLLPSLIVVLVVAGTGMFSYPLLTDLYTDRYLQEQLDERFTAISPEAWTRETLEVGSPLTRIEIPAIEVSTLVVEGTSPAALRAGAGHYPDTPLPGEVGNVAIAGHRTTYGRPFNRVDELVPGDEIWLRTPVGDHRYLVADPDPVVGANPWITGPTDWGVVAPTDDAVLTLTSCHPKGSAQQRIIVRAVLDRSVPSAAATGAAA